MNTRNQSKSLQGTSTSRAKSGQNTVVAVAFVDVVGAVVVHEVLVAKSRAHTIAIQTDIGLLADSFLSNATASEDQNNINESSN